MGKKGRKTTWRNSLSPWMLLRDKPKRDKAGNLVDMFVQHMELLQRIAGESYPLLSSMKERKKGLQVLFGSFPSPVPPGQSLPHWDISPPPNSALHHLAPRLDGTHPGYSVIFPSLKMEGDTESVKWQRDAGLSRAKLGSHGQPRISLT